MNVHVGHGCGYDLAVLVVDGVMKQRDINRRLGSPCFGFFFQSQTGFGKKSRTPLTGSPDTRLPSPLPYAFMITGKEYLWNFHAAKIFRASVLWIFQQPIVKRFILSRLFISQDTRDQPGHSVDHDYSGGVTSAQSKVAHGKFFVDK